MDLDFGQVIGIIANIGVIAGIVFVAVEVRQNNRLLEAQARYSLRQYRSDIADTIMTPHILEAAHKYARNESVTPAEKSAALMTALKVLELWEWQHGEFVAGMLRRESLPVDSWRLWYHGKGQSPLPIEEIWAVRKEVMNPAFVVFFEEHVVHNSPN
jgi:hypothetical protein